MKEASSGSKMYVPGETAHVKFDVSYIVPADPLLSYYTFNVSPAATGVLVNTAVHHSIIAAVEQPSSIASKQMSN
ncbi:MAG: hypothetical protein FWH55_14440 [Oscillospiraceae bacterium]|nr:hypothetical protein [Oscillospiraceae bacterium]